jgi:glycosyltransferase involved in cell wall biosynthesis
MPILSVVIITFNEEKNIGRCLKSIESIADEVIIIDSLSTDRTREIAKEFNAQFHSVAWKGYSFAKNTGNDLATGDYILWLDADEALNATLQRTILNWKKQQTAPHYCTINRLTNYCGKWIKYSGWYPDKKVRIFPKGSMRWDNEEVHESLMALAELPTQHLEGDLLHYSYYSFEQHREKADKYSVMTARKYVSLGKKAHFLQPFLSAVGRFLAMYVVKRGFLDGFMGFKIAQISAQSNYFKYQEVRRLQKGK